ncbi:hypothetical protein [Thermomonospora catenispora]|uniref:hypothetical protein n=1 Tax=Thermomonospora catenispora TaxID=2493090 RepID=UPI0011248EBE|nr:hypothetical protein [Thermomonospora catenispora]TNY37615.1 hypothetical protein EIO00_07375 [Thermomonospora catenispora]
MVAETVNRWVGRISARRLSSQCRSIAERVAAREPEFRTLSDADLAALTGAYRERIAAGEDLSDLAVEAFAAVREAVRRTLGLRLHEEQIMAGAAMAAGAIADMAAGEGKTLACAPPAYLWALEGSAVHVLTSDDHRAEQAVRRLEPVYRALGVDIGLIRPDLEQAARREAYASDVVYGSLDQIGFDLLRDDMASHPSEVVQRGLGVAVVDDARTWFIDELRRELRLSAAAPQEAVERRAEWIRAARSLSREAGDYAVDRIRRLVRLREPGIAKLRELLEVDDLDPIENAVPLALTAAVLRAREFAEKEEPAPDEEITVKKISAVGVLREYEGVCGVSTDAAPEAEIFRRCYGVTVVPIPSRRPAEGGPRSARAPEHFEEDVVFLHTVDLQRRETASRRAAVLAEEDCSSMIEDLLAEFVEQELHGLPRTLGREDVEDALDRLHRVCPISTTADELMRAPRRTDVAARLRDDVAEAYRRREDRFGSEVMRALGRLVLLRVLDRCWHEHLARAEALLDSLRLLDALGDDPLADHLNAVAESYGLLEREFCRNSVDRLFRLEVR